MTGTPGAPPHHPPAHTPQVAERASISGYDDLVAYYTRQALARAQAAAAEAAAGEEEEEDEAEEAQG